MFVIIDFRFSLLHVHMHHTPSRINICVEKHSEPKRTKFRTNKNNLLYGIQWSGGAYRDTSQCQGESRAIGRYISSNNIQSVWLPPGHCAVVSVTLDRIPKDLNAPKLMEPNILIHQKYGLDTTERLLSVLEDRLTQFTVTNNSSFTQRVEAGMLLGSGERPRDGQLRGIWGLRSLIDGGSPGNGLLWGMEGGRNKQTKEATVATAKQIHNTTCQTHRNWVITTNCRPRLWWEVNQQDCREYYELSSSNQNYNCTRWIWVSGLLCGVGERKEWRRKKRYNWWRIHLSEQHVCSTLTRKDVTK